MNVQDLTHVNAALNAVSVAFLVAGYIFIKSGRRDRHRMCMIGALVVSGAFLVTYITYKANSGFARFGGEGLVRPIYFTILALHVVGAVAIAGLVPVTAWRAFTGQFERHRRIARWTWPLWVYVGVSGVVVYVMAVHLYPYAGGAGGG